jgi:hypothetical protein
MNTLRKIRMVLMLVFGVPALLCVGGVAVWETLFGAVTVHALGPATVWVDGEEVVAIHDYDEVSFEVAQGQHTIRILGPSGAAEVTRDLDSAWDDWLFPSPDQCFLQLDVTDTFYGAGASEQPFIEARHGDGAMIELPAAWAFFSDDLPSSIGEHSHAFLFLDLPCDRIQDDEAVLLAELGL